MAEASRQRDLMWIEAVRSIGYHFSQIGDVISKYAEDANKLSEHARPLSTSNPQNPYSREGSMTKEGRRWQEESHLPGKNMSEREAYKRTPYSAGSSERGAALHSAHGYPGPPYYPDYGAHPPPMSRRPTSKNRGESMSDVHMGRAHNNNNSRMEDIEGGSGADVVGGTEGKLSGVGGGSGHNNNKMSNQPISKHDSGISAPMYGGGMNEEIDRKRKRQAEIEYDPQRHLEQTPPPSSSTLKPYHPHPHPYPYHINQYHPPPSAPPHHHAIQHPIDPSKPSAFKAKSTKRVRVNWSNSENEVFFKTIQEFSSCDETALLKEIVNALKGSRNWIQCKGHFRNLQYVGRITQSDTKPKKWIVNVTSNQSPQPGKPTRTLSGHASSSKPSSSATDKNINSPPPPPPPPPPQSTHYKASPSHPKEDESPKRSLEVHSSTRRTQETSTALRSRVEEDDEIMEEGGQDEDGDEDEDEDDEDEELAEEADEDEDEDRGGRRKKRSKESKNDEEDDEHRSQSKYGHNGALEHNIHNLESSSNVATTATTTDTANTTTTTATTATTTATMTTEKNREAKKLLTETTNNEERLQLKSTNQMKNDDESDNNAIDNGEDSDGRDKDYDPIEDDGDDDDDDDDDSNNNINNDNNQRSTSSVYSSRKSDKNLRGMISSKTNSNNKKDSRKNDDDGNNNSTKYQIHTKSCVDNDENNSNNKMISAFPNRATQDADMVDVYNSMYKHRRNVSMPLKKTIGEQY